MSKISHFSCSSCFKSFKHRPSLSRHKKVCSKSEVKLSCSNCRKEFYRKDSLKRHMLTCSGKKIEPFCSSCNTFFKTNWHLKRHVAQVHTTNKRKQKQLLETTQNRDEMQPLIDLSLIVDNFDDTDSDWFIPSMVTDLYHLWL